MADFDKKYNIVNEKVPRHTLLSAHYKQSFAYYTLRERLPVILTQVIDNLSRDKDDIAKQYGEDSREEVKEIVGNLSKLKYQLQTDKPLEEFTGNEPDKNVWNDFIATLPSDSNSFFTTCWLYAECYMYRKIKSYFEEKEIMKDYDYFRKQKRNVLTCCTDSLEIVVESTRINEQVEDCGSFFRKLLKLNLWGNRCDLSISEGKEIKQTGNPFDAIESLEKYILIDDTENIWNCISKPYTGDRIVDIVLDNSGYELFTDFLIAEFIIDQKLATKIRFHPKAIPWFISDVNPSDFHWTLKYLSNHESITLQKVGQKWSDFLANGIFILADVNYFWTGPFEFYRMEKHQEDLYNKLAESHLVIFKGDLNYRKLIGDFSWDFTENFKTCLRGFLPSNLCTLRTVKADLICGLKDGVAENLFLKDPLWMTTGEYGVIQFASKN